MKTIKSLWLQLLQLTVLVLITASASAQLRAEFSATPTSGCPPMVVSFKDSSTGNPTAYKWDLGNGTISFLQNPIATYFYPGTYNVKLVVSNASGKDSIVKQQYIVVNNLPEPEFSASDSTGCFPLNVNFTDKSLAGSGTISSWQWDFGDGTLSTDQNPSHTYTSPGNFTVILRVVNSKGCSRVISKSAYIKIQNGVKANFSYSSVQGCHTPAPVNFINTTTGIGTINYKWDFGDGGTSTLANPTHSYVTSGAYSVRLIASSAYGCADTMVVDNAINIGAVKANFTLPDSICAGANFQLTNTSVPASFVGTKWYFGDSTTSTAVNPKKTFNNGGTFTVKLVTDFGSCRDSITKTIRVMPKPVVTFTASNISACKAPLTASFANTTPGTIAYAWTFGDGGTSTIANPTHTYTNTGSYNVKLTVRNTSNCVNHVVKNNLVKIIPPKINSIKNLGIKGCLPITIKPVAVVPDSNDVSSYFWNFGDGATSTSASPSHTYTTAGIYDVTLIITTAPGCTDTLIVAQAVKAGNKPVAAFGADPKDICAYTPVNFKDSTTGATVTEWLWEFGDGGTSIEQHPTYTYNDTGRFDVTLMVWNYGCSDTLIKEDYIRISPPIAKFDTSFTCANPLNRIFTDKSIGATSWEWNFGDGGTSTQANPTHKYAASGIYKVSLKVSNGSCYHISEKDVLVIKEHGNLEVSQIESCINARLIFKVANIADSNITKFNWYLDGINQPSVVTTGNNPIAWNIRTPGIRPAAVVITDILGCSDTAYSAVPVKTFGSVANFGSAVTTTCFGNTIQFADSSKTDGIHPIIEYRWDFGDTVKTFTSGPFSHNYTAAGDYDITLFIKDSYGCVDSITKQSFLSITRPIAKFTPSDTILCPALPIAFTNQSEGEGATYTWNFGDGNTSTEFSPTYTYSNPGAYKVKMVMVDKNGCSDSASVLIKVFTAKAAFVMSDSFSTCPPLVVSLTNQSSNYISLNWDFGDGATSQLVNPSHIYTSPGVFKVRLSVLNNGGCTDTATRTVVIRGPSGNFNYIPKEVCSPGKVAYSLNAQNAVKYIWDFNDGTTIYGTTDTVSHLYVTPGVYLPKIILEDSFGCRVAVTGLDTVKVYGIQTYIQSSSRIVCDSGIVHFNDSTITNDIATGFLWNFGDGQTSTLRNPIHNYTTSGLFNVTLTTTSRFGCIDTARSEKHIKVVKSPDIKIAGNLSACEPVKLKFEGQLVTPDTSAIRWNWTFGNGNTSTSATPDSQSYAAPGNYTVSLKATNSDGCIDTTSVTATIHPKPVVNAGLDAMICRFSTHTLTATGADTYTWKSHPSLSCTDCASPVVRPDSAVTYLVTGTTTFGCTDVDSVTISVKQPFQMQVSKGDTICVGETVTLRATGADNYQWQPSRWLDNAANATVRTKPDSTITYQVIGSDKEGCFKDTVAVNVKVYPIPHVEITNGNDLTVQVGTSVKLVAKTSADVTSLRWNPGQWLSCTTCAEPVALPQDNITYTVTASNDGKCLATDNVTIKMLCNNANVYMPNTFSPNGDGVNDVFFPRGAGLDHIKSFKIFNRWGQLLFDRKDISANNPTYGWTGTLNGVPLQTDVYVYILEVVCANNVVFPFKGNVSLIR